MASRALMVLVSKLEGREDGSQLSVSGKDLWFFKKFLNFDYLWEHFMSKIWAFYIVWWFLLLRSYLTNVGAHKTME